VRFPRATIIFISIYVLLNLAYLFVFVLYRANVVVVFITSPFNIIEVTGSNSPVLSFLANFVLVVMVLLLAELYSDFSVMPFSAGTAFVMAIVASYVISVLRWVLRGFPSAGTSIIGFSMLLYLIVSGVLDMKAGGEAPVWLVALVPSLVVAPWYVLYNASWPLHVAGALMFFGLCIFYLSLRRAF